MSFETDYKEVSSIYDQVLPRLIAQSDNQCTVVMLQGEDIWYIYILFRNK
uniref:Uncharacterized protein n=1 Tax=Arundo donax TaxID=35708 RepID=A0A0A9H624_ARUDO